MMESGPAYETVPFLTEAEQRSAVGKVAAHQAGGGLIVYPTETVYGFGCFLDAVALGRLAALKRRAPDKAFLMLVADAAMIEGVQWTASARALASAFWPGPLTLALRAEPGAFPAPVVGPNGTVAVRATSHPGMRILLEALAVPLTSTSANVPGSPPATSGSEAGRVACEAGAEGPILLLDGGTLLASASSTIVDCSVEPPRIIRVGAISVAQLAERMNGIDATES